MVCKNLLRSFVTFGYIEDVYWAEMIWPHLPAARKHWKCVHWHTRLILWCNFSDKNCHCHSTVNKYLIASGKATHLKVNKFNGDVVCCCIDSPYRSHVIAVIREIEWSWSKKLRVQFCSNFTTCRLIRIRHFKLTHVPVLGIHLHHSQTTVSRHRTIRHKSTINILHQWLPVVVVFISGMQL